MSAEKSNHRVILIVGGVRSGKSRYALQLAANAQRVTFIATAEARDAEMAQRIARHQQERPHHWETVEAPIALPETILASEGDFTLVDCLTLWASNLMEREEQNCERIHPHVDRLIQALQSASATTVLVSNEVGSGIVPESEMGRSYRDVLGSINQRVAAVADEVLLMVAGCPLVIKQAAETVPA
jgi:adenosylcobinamide kinase / adenosylcobinamide-phosphate guanylyltransferase